jgi:hypothetical protein
MLRSTPYETIKIEKEDHLSVDLTGKYYPHPKNKIVEINGCDYEEKFCVYINFLLDFLFKFI